jgi:hypothetical protein
VDDKNDDERDDKNDVEGIDDYKEDDKMMMRMKTILTR